MRSTKRENFLLPITAGQIEGRCLPVNLKYTAGSSPKLPLIELTPRQYFDQFFSPDFFASIAYETNLYSVQTTGNSVDITSEEIVQFVGILIEMVILQYPQYNGMGPENLDAIDSNCNEFDLF